MALRGWLALLACGGALTACGSDANGGSAPRLFEFSVYPDEVYVGESTRVSGEILMRDPDGDVVEGRFQLTRPGGIIDPEMVVSTDVAGSQEAALNFSYEVRAIDPGRHLLALWVIDSAGNESNHQTLVLNAVPNPYE